MYRLKSIKLYFYSILKLFFLGFRNFYFKSSFYNKKLITTIPSRIFYNPSSYLSASLININNDFYKVAQISPELLWNTNYKNKIKFDNLHNFLWLARLDRKDSKIITKNIIKSWIKKFFDYDPKTWEMEIVAKRIIAWTSNTDITLENSDKIYKEVLFKSLIKQSNFILNNLNILQYDSSRIICCSAIILSGILFEEYDSNYKIGMKELEKSIKYIFDETGFPKSRNPEEVFICIKYLVLIREWLKESQREIPDFLNETIEKCGSCYKTLSCSNKQFPLFNGATEINFQDYDKFIKNLKYKFISKNNEASSIVKIKKKTLEFFIDCGNAPSNNFAKSYQAGCLSFELISNKQKIICNTGYGKYLSPKLKSLSCSTAAHSTLYLNDTSSCIFQKNEIINKVFGSSLIEKHKIINKNYNDTNDFYSIESSHNGYEKKFGYIHKRSIKIPKEKDKILGLDELIKTKKNLKNVFYFIRFHIYPNLKIVKTKAGNAVLISLSNGEGWLLKCKTNNLSIEKNIFLGNKNKVMNNESIAISGVVNEEITSIEWFIERIS
jgi:uncharacterized heparinase superfamily protein